MDILPAHLRSHLEKILSSAGFAHSQRMSRFLRFAVEQTMQGRGDKIKEYLVGVEVFDKEPSYDPQIDPIVRVEARRLRSKLKRYYETDGREDALRIDFPKGSYVPVFQERNSADPPEIKTIAVLPFVNRSPDPENEYFSDGLTEELIRALTKIEGLRVVAPGTAFQFKGKSQDVQQIGEQLHVSAVLQGSVRRAGTRLRVTAQLISVRDGCYLWSETYERELQDVFVIQDEISRAIVNTLRLQLAAGRQTPLVRRYSDNLEVYSIYLKGRHYFNRRTEEGFKKSVECFEQALVADPHYAPAYAGIADAYSLLAEYGFQVPDQAMPKARAAALRALEIDDGLAEAEVSLAFVYTTYEWKFEEADRHYRRALELNPGYAEAHHWYGYDHLAILGRLDEAMAHVELAHQLDPLSMIISASLGGIFLMRREYDRAIEQYRKTLALDPGFYKAYTGLGRSYFQKGMYDEAVRYFRKGRVLSAWNRGPSFSDSRLKLGTEGGALYTAGGLGQSYAMAGETETARHLVSEMERLREDGLYVQATSIALIYVGLGDADKAFHWLDKACTEREASVLFISVYPAWDALRSDPRFVALLRRIGIVR